MKEELESKLKKIGFRLFSEMSYEEYEPYEKRVECSDLTYIVMDCFDVYPYYVKMIKDCLVIAAYVDEERDMGMPEDKRDVVDWLYVVLLPQKDEDLLPAFEELTALFRQHKIPMKLGTMSERDKLILEQHESLKDAFFYQQERSDYVYRIEEYLDTGGKSNAWKRRDLNKLFADYSNVRVEPVTNWDEAKKAIMEILGQWCQEHACENCMYRCEQRVLEYLLDSPLKDKLCGAILYVDDAPEMFAVAQNIGDVCYLNFKKSANRIKGAFYYFEKCFLEMQEGITYVNFQEDLGLPGLREYKRRRHPCKMIDKYETGVFYWNIDCAKRGDWKELTQLWSQGFGDAPAYVEAFLERFYQPDNVFVWREKSEIASVVYTLPAKVILPDETSGSVQKEGCYLYAITTKQAFRGQRLAKKIIAHIQRKWGNDRKLFLVPEKNVIPYYESMGMVLQQATSGFVYGQQQAWNDEPSLQKISVTPLGDAKRYRHLREQALQNCLREKGQGYVSWDENHIAWALENIKDAGGQVYEIAAGDKQDILAGIICRENGVNRFKVMETTWNEQDFEAFGQELLSKLNCSYIERKQGMMMLQKPLYDSIYLAFPLDD